jgi:hypothetical protein
MRYAGRHQVRPSAALGLVVFAGFMTAFDARASANDPLSRPEFSKEISIAVSNMDAAAVFRAIGIATGVPFILDFTPDPTLTVSIEATNMGCRGILESLASSYSLEYGEGPTGVLVRRVGGESIDTPFGVTPSPASAALYWFDLYVRDADGRVQRFPRSFREAGHVESGVFHMGDRDTTIPILNRGSATVTDVSVGAFELALGVRSDDGSSLAIAAELIERRFAKPRSYVEQHTIAVTRVADHETQLFRTARGESIVLAAWGRVTQRPASSIGAR